MKKVLFLLLFLLVLGAAGVSAQVRIGGDGEPNEAAVLDLNEDDATDTGTKGLALPRVSLNKNDDKLGYSGLLEGMLVYNTNADITGGDGVGVYYWDGSQWVKPAGGSDYTGSTSIVLSGNSFQRAALSGDVSSVQNNNIVTIRDGAVSQAKTTLKYVGVSPKSWAYPAGSSTSVQFPAECANTYVWYTVTCGGYCNYRTNSKNVELVRVGTGGASVTDKIHFYCFD